MEKIDKISTLPIGEFGSYLAGTQISDLPTAVIESAKLRLLDLFCAGLAGYRIGRYRPVLAAMQPAAGECLVWGEGKSVSVRDAALINSFMAHSTYFEDGSRATGGHPSSAIIPAVVSLGEVLSASGKQIILSMVLGYDIFIRIGSAVYPSTVARGFQPTAILAALGAAAGCAKLLGLDEKGCAHALAIGANLGSGLKEALKESASQPIQVGRSCEGGLMAALLAKQGLKGYANILDPFLQAHAEKINREAILNGLGQGYKIEETYLKVHGGCRGNHAPVDVALKIVAENRLTIREIDKIRIGIDSVTEASEIQRPANGEEAQFSIAFSIAVALVYHDASLFQYTDERVHDPAVRSFMERIEVEVMPEMDRLLPDKRGASGEIITRDGRSYRAKIDIARGEPEDPFSPDDMEKKFKLVAESVLGKNTSRLIDAVHSLENMADIRDLTGLLKDDING